MLDYRSGTGKRVGADLRQRKVTLPLIHAMNVDEGIRDVLEGTPSEPTVRDLVRRVEATGATETSLAHARTLVLEAVDSLNDLPPSEGQTGAGGARCIPSGEGIVTRRIVVGISGASGSPYAHRLLQVLDAGREQFDIEPHLVFSKPGPNGVSGRDRSRSSRLGFPDLGADGYDGSVRLGIGSF